MKFRSRGQRPPVALVAAAAATAALLLSAVSVPAFADSQTPGSVNSSSPTHSTTDPTATAIATAESTGDPVPVDSLTTATRTTTANPDGSLSTHIDAQPVRTHRDASWIPLDATLSTAGGGQLAPAATTDPITLSGGGDGPLATLTDAGGHSISLTLPFTLPAPEIDGASALYESVIPGVDLQATVDPQGGFSDVLIVQNAQAAADPRLARLTFAVSANGLAVHQDSTGLELTAPDGTVSYSAPQPLMWDSSTGDAAAETHAAKQSAATADDGSGSAPTSSADGPGTGAQVAPLGVTASDTSLTLTPDQQMLTSPDTTWPLYIDPTITAATTGSKFDQLYMSGSCAGTPLTGKAQTNGEGVGYQHWDTSCGFAVERTLYQFNVSGLASNFVVSKAMVNLTETFAAACSHAATLKLRTLHPFDGSTDGNSQPTQSTNFTAVYSDAVTSGTGSLCSGAAVSFTRPAPSRRP